MKLVIAIVLLALLAIGGFILTSNSADAPSVNENVPATSQELEAIENSDTEAYQLVEDVESNSMTFTLDSFNFGYSLEEIRVPVGTEVTINLTNSGGFHDWVVDEFSAATDKIGEGATASVTFIADKEGSFEYYCSVGSHRAQGMVGTLIVE